MIDAAEFRRRLFDSFHMSYLNACLTRVDPAAAPETFLVGPEFPTTGVPRLAVFSGSFNPLTLAHCAVVEAAAATGLADLVVYTLSTHTTDKEEVTGAALADRLAVLVAHTHGRAGEGVLLVNRGLYVEQARLLHSMPRGPRELWFVVGFDKIVQVFDPRYYADREAALDELFGLASFLVAPRAGADAAMLDELLGREENRRFANRVRWLAVEEMHADISSTRARVEIEQHGHAGGLPEAAALFIEATGAYRTPGMDGVAAYAPRRKLLEEARKTGLQRTSHEFQGFLRQLEAMARRGGRAGQALRPSDGATTHSRSPSDTCPAPPSSSPGPSCAV